MDPVMDVLCELKEISEEMKNRRLSANFFTSRKLKGLEPCRVKRSGLFGRKYEYNIESPVLLRKVMRENPDVNVSRCAGIVSSL